MSLDTRTGSAIAVLTAKSAAEILASRGSGSWVLNPRNARRQSYLVCVRNADNFDGTAGEPHGTAFLVCLISGVVQLPDVNGLKRWRVTFDRYARVDVPDVWKGWRNPVRYTTLGELGVDLDPLALETLPGHMPGPVNPEALRAKSAEPQRRDVRPLTIPEAKAGLALTLGVDPNAIEITIKG